MHLQAHIQNWNDAIIALPDNAIVKSVSDAGLLHEAAQVWQAAGRDHLQLTTCYRHYDLLMPPRGWDWELTKFWCEMMIRRYVDKTYLENYASSIDLVQGTNETTSNTTWDDPVDAAYHIRAEAAMVSVWNGQFRGRTVQSVDGGEGFIPASCKMTLLSGPVGNDIPKEIFRLSLSEDAPIDYHAYMHVENGVRDTGDWRWHSGRWSSLEDEYGLHPQWIFGECGPYLDTIKGWRHPDVLDGDVHKLTQAMRAWYTDVVSTPAFREERILGQGAWFTSGVSGWEYYQYGTSDLIAVCDAIRDLWEKQETKMTTFTANTEGELLHSISLLEKAGFQLTSRRIVHVAEMEVRTEPQPLFKVRVIVGAGVPEVGVLNIRSGPAATFPDIGDVLEGQEFDVWEVAPSGWYRIHQTEQRWISGNPLYTVRI